MKVGDKVLILATYVPGPKLPILPETFGTIETVDVEGDLIRVFIPIEHISLKTIRMGAYGHSWLFRSSDLQLCYQMCDQRMYEPEFDLEDMELAEILMEELSHEDR